MEVTMETTSVTAHEKHDDVLRALGRAIFFLSFPLGFLSFALPIYGKELGATALEIGTLFSAFFLISTLLRPLLGRLVDRYGRRPFLLLGVAGYVGAALLFLLDGGLLVLLAARLVEGAAQSFLWLSAYAIVADCSPPDERGRRFGRVEAQLYRGVLVGAFVGFPCLDYLGIVQGWKAAFAVYTVLALVALLLAWRGVRETLPAVLPSAPARGRVSPQLYALMGIAVLTTASLALLTPVLMIFLQERFGAPVHDLAVAYVPAAVLHGLLPSYLGRIADRVGRKLPMIVGLLAAAATSLAIPFADSMILIAVAWAVEAVCFSAATPAQEALVADHSEAEARGTGYGLYTLASGLGATIGPVLGGWVYDARGHAMPFYLNAAILVVGALLVLALVRERRL
jgi:DHA1 family multidrug resistance protein-like MFS transporter